MSDVPEIVIQNELKYIKISKLLRTVLELTELKHEYMEEIVLLGAQLKQSQDDFKKAYDSLPKEIKKKLKYGGIKHGNEKHS